MIVVPGSTQAGMMAVKVALLPFLTGTKNDTEYPLTLNTMSAMIFPFPELPFINLDGLMRTADLLRVVLQVDGHSLLDKLSPVGDRSGTVAIFVYDTFRRHVVKDFVR